MLFSAFQRAFQRALPIGSTKWCVYVRIFAFWTEQFGRTNSLLVAISGYLWNIQMKGSALSSTAWTKLHWVQILYIAQGAVRANTLPIGLWREQIRRESLFEMLGEMLSWRCCKAPLVCASSKLCIKRAHNLHRIRFRIASLSAIGASSSVDRHTQVSTKTPASNRCQKLHPNDG